MRRAGFIVVGLLAFATLALGLAALWVAEGTTLAGRLAGTGMVLGGVAVMLGLWVADFAEESR